MKINPKVDKIMTIIAIVVLIITIGCLLQVAFTIANEEPYERGSEPWGPAIHGQWSPVYFENCTDLLEGKPEDPCKRSHRP